MKHTILVLLLTLLLITTACTPATTLSPETACTTDADCVPAQCCHPTSAVNKDFAPDCAGALCTLNCEPNTLDCGQGQIKCLENKCTAVINT